jgi:Rps23 Pro-64 3,4-dihydroxylase Tpa1-like proline 4-hydroxylase
MSLNQFTLKSHEELMDFAHQHAAAYKSNLPFPNIYFDEFFNPEILKDILKELPELGSEKTDIHYANPNESKYASKGEFRFGPKTKAFMHYLNSQPFLEFLQVLSGIEETLIPDPYFEGGGFHQIKPGGFLKVHVDFHSHKLMNLDRRINVLIYLNENWEESYGGHFELWETDMSKSVVRIAPLFNRLAMFSTTGNSYHGHPDVLTCPPDRSRKSLALYYYSNGRPANELNDDQRGRITTTFAARKGIDSKKMKAFNTFVNLANDLLPPLVVRTIKKFRNK